MKKIKRAIFSGLGFGLTSGVITTLGLMIGLFSLAESKMVVIGGILTIAIADSLSDALGIHISKESEDHHSCKEVWIATFFTFLSKFLLSISFIIPVLFLELKLAIIISVFYGLMILILLSYVVASRTNEKKINSIFEHLLIAIFVIIITYYLGRFVSIFFGV